MIRPVKRPTGFESFKQAKLRRAKLIGTLLASDTAPTRNLARVLSDCRKDARCNSGACAVCGRSLRLNWLSAVADVLEPSDSLFRLSFVPRVPVIVPGALHTFDLTLFVGREQRALQRLLPTSALLFCGVDFSLNTTENLHPVWVPHLYGLIAIPVDVEIDLKELRRALKRRAAPPAISKRPVALKAVEYDALTKTAPYAIKTEFYRRSSYGYVRRATGRPTTNVRAQRLSAAATVELFTFLGRHSFTDRMLLIGVRRYWRAANFILRHTAASVVEPDEPNSANA